MNNHKQEINEIIKLLIDFFKEDSIINSYKLFNKIVKESIREIKKGTYNKNKGKIQYKTEKWLQAELLKYFYNKNFIIAPEVGVRVKKQGNNRVKLKDLAIKKGKNGKIV